MYYAHYFTRSICRALPARACLGAAQTYGIDLRAGSRWSPNGFLHVAPSPIRRLKRLSFSVQLLAVQYVAAALPAAVRGGYAQRESSVEPPGPSGRRLRQGRQVIVLRFA